HRTGVDVAVRVGGDVTERDALGGEGLLHRVSVGLRPLARLRRLLLELRAHLARQARDRTEAEKMRGVPLVRGAGPLAVAAQERVLRLRAGAVDPALRMAAEAAEGVGAARRSLMDATRPRRGVDRLPVRSAAA